MSERVNLKICLVVHFGLLQCCNTLRRVLWCGVCASVTVCRSVLSCAVVFSVRCNVVICSGLMGCIGVSCGGLRQVVVCRDVCCGKVWCVEVMIRTVH